MATPTRLNVSIAPYDDRLKETLIQIRDLTLVDSHEARDLLEAVNLRAARVGEAVESTVVNSLALGGLADGFTLDLIAHANASGVLQLGEWQIDESEVQSQELARRFQALKIKPRAIRLLGCNTGLFAGGQRAMRHLSEVFGDVKIFGAIAQLHSRNFEASGLSPDCDKLLRTTDELPRPEDPATLAASRRQFEMLPPAPPIEDVFEHLRAESLEDATHDVRHTLPRARWPVRQLGPQAWNSLLGPLIQDQLATAPGLLAAPEAEALLAVDPPAGEPRFHRATLLLAGWLVRVYPVGVPEGVILRSQVQLTLDGGTPVQLPPVGVAAGSADGT